MRKEEVGTTLQNRQGQSALQVYTFYFFNDLCKPKMKAELHKFAQIQKPCVGYVDIDNRLDVYNYNR